MQLNAKRADLAAFADNVPPAESEEACFRAFQDELVYVHHTLRRLGAPPSDIEDLMQEVFLALRGSWARCDRSRPLRPYLFGIAFRIVSAHRRKRDREMPFGVIEPIDEQAGAEDRLQSKQARRLVLAALGRVPLPRRAVLIMHELDDVPVADVASTLRIPRFTVYSRLRKARRELSAALRAVVNEV